MIRIQQNASRHYFVLTPLGINGNLRNFCTKRDIEDMPFVVLICKSNVFRTNSN